MKLQRLADGLGVAFLAWLLLSSGSWADESKATDTVGNFENEVAPFFARHCYSCHGPEKQESQIRLDQFTGYEIEREQLWTSIHEMISAGEMPPEDRPQPTASDRQRVLKWIEVSSANARQSLGSGKMRRLNRRELSAALQDLTGLQVDYAAGLPGDGSLGGFDTGAAALNDSDESVAQVLRVAQRAVEGVYFLNPPEFETFSANLREDKDARKAFDPWKQRGAKPKIKGTVRPGEGLLIEPKWVGERGGVEVKVPAPNQGKGVLRLRMLLSVFKPHVQAPDPILWVSVGARTIDRVEINQPGDQPIELTYDVQLDDVAVEADGVKISLSNKVEIPYAVPGFENEDKTKPDTKIPGGPGLFRPKYDRKKTPTEEQPVPFVVLHEIEIQSGYVAAWPPAHWNTELGDIADDESSAVRLLEMWMERAWRRTVKPAEQEHFLGFYRLLRQQGLGFDDALRATFQSVLMSGPFRYLASPSHSDSEVAQYAIASRLSFFLWGTPPDRELRELARKNQLRDPKVLAEQVDRLLADPRSDGFVRPFVRQWLELEQPITFVMDHFEQQDFRFGRHLKASMKEETIAVVTHLLRENRPARELIQSDWTMMNESLAWHYGYEGVQGTELRLVKLRKDDPRGGGILGHAGIQSMLCWMGENWVIYRGAWTLRHILNDPLPPPPLEVPELDPSDNANRGKTMRELLLQHQADSKCNVCHKHMDPLGFAFQNFDISGRWRSTEFEKYNRTELDGKIAWKGAGKERPVDAHGTLPRGEAFASFEEAKQLIADHYMPDVVEGLLNNVTIYAAGRAPHIEDRKIIDQILEDQKKSGYPMRDLVKAIVTSPIFLGKISEEDRR